MKKNIEPKDSPLVHNPYPLFETLQNPISNNGLSGFLWSFGRIHWICYYCDQQYIILGCCNQEEMSNLL